MTVSQTLRYLAEKNILSNEQYEALIQDEQNRPISVHWEIRIFLLAGMSFLSTGLGMLVYKNIETIGHQAIIGVIALAIIFCGVYVYRNRQPFLVNDVQKTQPFADHLLLLGCTLFLILEGYLQYQYQVFGTQYGVATLIPAILFLFCAYRFEHIGVLTMGLTAFVAWTGLNVTPLSILHENSFSNQPTLIHTGIVVGFLLILVGIILNNRSIKPHFTFSYLNYGFNMVCIAALYGAFEIMIVPYCLLCLVVSIGGILYARYAHSYFFLLAGVIFGYISFTTLIFQVLPLSELWLFYGMFSCFGIISFFINFKKLLK